MTHSEPSTLAAFTRVSFVCLRLASPLLYARVVFMYPWRAEMYFRKPVSRLRLFLLCRFELGGGRRTTNVWTHRSSSSSSSSLFPLIPQSTSPFPFPHLDAYLFRTQTKHLTARLARPLKQTAIRPPSPGTRNWSCHPLFTPSLDGPLPLDSYADSHRRGYTIVTSTPLPSSSTLASTSLAQWAISELPRSRSTRACSSPESGTASKSCGIVSRTSFSAGSSPNFLYLPLGEEEGRTTSSRWIFVGLRRGRRRRDKRILHASTPWKTSLRL